MPFVETRQREGTAVVGVWLEDGSHGGARQEWDGFEISRKETHYPLRLGVEWNKVEEKEGEETRNLE